MPLAKTTKINQSKVKRVRFREHPTRKEDPQGWYASRKDRINAKRRAKRSKNKEHHNAYNRAWYAEHKAEYRQNTPEGKLERKLKRNGIGKT